MFDHKDHMQGVGADPKHDVIQIDSEDSANSIDVMEVSDAEQSDRSDGDATDPTAAMAPGGHVAYGQTQGGPVPPQNQASAASSYPLANDFENMSQRLMKPEPDYPVKASQHFVWEIKDWNAARKENKLASPQFECAGFKWNILMFPRGNNDSVSLYMEPHPQPDESGEIDPKWYVCAQFAFDVWNPNHPESHHPNASSHRFNKNDTDWGFSTFISLSDLASTHKVNQSHPILENNTLNITGYVRVIDDSQTGVLWSNLVDYDSKSSTGYVGLSNQGATCYLNSLVQSYFTTRVFKNLVYEIPTDDQSGDRGKNSKAVALALQRIFYLLQSSNDCVSTLELTKSFGWDSSDAFTQHDVQELNRVLMDKLESAMKGTKIEKSLNDIFVGKMKSFIKCVNVKYESTREEDFWDIQLNVKGFQNLEQSFQNYIEIEMLDGENKYQAGDEFGYQDAKKGVVFESFPPVLHLQLKRFEYDFMVDDLVKIDDLYEFPDQIDLSPYLDDELDESVKNQNWNYKLHGVLVHQGSISNGHYYAMIKPEANDNLWMRFEDDKVWKVTPSKVFQENFGAPDLSPAQIRSLSRMEQNEYIIRRATSAYMLVYYRESELATILPDRVAPIPKHVSEQIEREREEQALLERKKQEALYYVHVKIVTSANFTYFNGFDLYPDPSKPKEYDPEIYDSRAYPDTVMVRKDATFAKFVKLVAQKLGYAEAGPEQTVPLDLSAAPEDDDEDLTEKYPFALATLKQRNNKTNRPDTLISEDMFGEKVIDVLSKCFRKKYDEVAFYVLEDNKELQSIEQPDSSVSPELFDFDKVSQQIAASNKTADKLNVNDVVLFIKYYDMVTDQVRGLSYLSVSRDTTVSSLSAGINKLLGLDPSTELTYFEEVSRLKIEPIDPALTVEKNELGTGDVLAVQIANIESVASEDRFGDIQAYYKFLLTRLHIQVKPCKVTEEEEDSDFVADEDQNGDKENERESSVTADTAEAKEIQLAKEISKSFDLWVSTTYTYQELAACIAKKINGDVDPQYLRIFLVNNHGTRYPLSSSTSLSQIFAKQVAVSSISQFEYEILNITLKEYENMKAIKISWLDSVVQFHSLELLVPKNSTVANLVEKVVHKLNIPQSKWSGLLVWASKDDKYDDLLKFDKSIEEVNDQLEIFCGYFPAEVEILVSHDMFKRFTESETKDGSDIEDPVLRSEFHKAQELSKSLNIIPAFHFQKSTSYTHSIPFVFAVFPDEPFEETKERLKRKLGFGKQAFEKVRIALADITGKGKYLDSDNKGLSLFDEMSKFESHVSLALDHRDRNPRRQNPYDKGITIG